MLPLTLWVLTFGIFASEDKNALAKEDIACNNLHEDSFGLRDFTKADRITLATVHKAKGNESFMVYVIGVDAVMADPSVKRRNMLFTAMTRAKGWVRVSGVGEDADQCRKEIGEAKKNFPNLIFTYPDPEQVKRMKRDLAEAADKKLKARRLAEKLNELTDDEIDELFAMAKQGKRFAGKAKGK